MPGDDPQQLWDAIAEKYDADLITYFGPVQQPHDRDLLSMLERRQRRPNVILWLATFGGDPHVAYRLARCLQLNYKTTEKGEGSGTFTVFVDTFCKSAGTIMVLGSNRLVMSDYAELGPIDPQLRVPDSGLERSSSLTPMQSLNALQEASFELFGYYFRQLRSEVTWNLTTKTASEIAAKMAIGLVQPIYAQLDPIRLGEIDRFTKVVLQYGRGLQNGNLRPEAVERLLAGYPSHSFVIDRREASELFVRVDPPDELLRKLSTIRDYTEQQMQEGQATITFLNTPLSGPVKEPTASIVESETHNDDFGQKADNHHAGEADE